jgi:hypothetical protein
MENRDLLQEAYAALEAARTAYGAERYLLIDRALELWRAAHGAGPAPEPRHGPANDWHAPPATRMRRWKG